MKKFLTIAMVGAAILAAGLPTAALAQRRGGPPGGSQVSRPSGQRESARGSQRNGRGGERGSSIAAQGQHRGGWPQGGPRGGYPSRGASFRGGCHGGHGGDHGWSTAGQILTGVFIGGLLADVCSPQPVYRQVVYAPSVYQPPVVQYVQAPAVQYVQQVPAVETVWMENSNGSRTPVQLRRADGGMYVGPKGEYYLGLPTNEQLRQIYGM